MATENIDSMQLHELMWEQYQSAGERALRFYNTEEAERMFSLALERSQMFGDKDLRMMQTLRLLVKCYTQSRQFSRAEELLEPLLETLYEKFGATSPELLDALRMLSNVYEHQCRFTQAAQLLKYVLDNHPNRISRDADFTEMKKQYESFIQMTGKWGNDEHIQWLH